MRFALAVGAALALLAVGSPVGAQEVTVLCNFEVDWCEALKTTYEKTTGQKAVFIRRSITHSLRDTEALLMAVILPTMLMLLFTYVFGGALGSQLPPSVNYKDYLMAGIFVQTVIFGATLFTVRLNVAVSLPPFPSFAVIVTGPD